MNEINESSTSDTSGWHFAGSDKLPAGGSKVFDRVLKVGKMVRAYDNWLLALADRLHLLKSGPALYRLRKGTQFAVKARTLDVQVINEIWIDKIYTPSRDFAIKDGWTVLDIGGQKGMFSVFAATSAKGVKVYTFEPSPESFASLTQNVELNKLSNVKLFNIAVGKDDGLAILHLAKDSVEDSLLLLSAVPMRGDVVVNTWPLQKILNTVGSPVDLLKMDIEGMEYDTLLTCPPDALRQVRRIALEYHDHKMSGVYTVRHLSEFLTANGFSVRLNTARRILMAWQPQ